MAIHRSSLLQPLSVLVLLTSLMPAALPDGAQAGPLIRRAQERRACQEFAGKLQQAGGNPAMAQQIYQQGVLQLVSRFGENPCTDIPAPVTASATASTPAAAPASATAGAAASGAPPTAGPAPSAQQQQACQQFAGKLQAAAASGGSAAAQQTYAMGLEKLSGMFGANPCPAVKPPQ
jgi:hypothetical protein